MKKMHKDVVINEKSNVKINEIINRLDCSQNIFFECLIEYVIDNENLSDKVKLSILDKQVKKYEQKMKEIINENINDNKTEEKKEQEMEEKFDYDWDDEEFDDLSEIDYDDDDEYDYDDDERFRVGETNFKDETNNFIDSYFKDKQIKEYWLKYEIGYCDENGEDKTILVYGEGDVDWSKIPEECLFYDSGFGVQYWNGWISFTDGSWMSREEYDGSEWWKENTTPKLSEYVKQ